MSIRGLTGRTLQLGVRKNPSNEWHIGVKPLFDAFPEDLVERMKSERSKVRSVEFQNEIAHLEAEALTPGAKDPLWKQEHENRIQLAQAWQKSASNDFGPVVDCVVYNDGTNWRAIVDTSEKGECAELPAMANYFLERQYRRFSDRDLMNFCVNIYNNGNTLCIVTPAGSHGTHVAGIVGAYYPTQPELNGYIYDVDFD